MEQQSRPNKRSRQACDPCRRKKSKCPGERPSCSYCVRLGQQCVYEDHDSDPQAAGHKRRMERRMEDLEDKMDRLIDQLSPLAEAATRQQSSVQPPTPGLTATSAEGQGAVRAPRRRSIVAQHAEDYDGSHSRRRTGSYLASSHASDLVLDGAALRTAGQMYLTWCHNQPLCFFQADTFLDSLKTRDAPLLLALQALALRFPPGVLTLRKKKQLADMANAARQLAMDAIANSQVELSTIQTLCFLSLVDLADGKPLLAQLDLDTASSLTRAIPAGFVLGDPQECSDCIQSILTAQNLHGYVSPSPRSAVVPGTHEPAFSRAGFPQPQIENSILACSYQMSDAWRMARDYAAAVVGPDAPPPWSRQSDYSAVTQRHLELDTSIPLKYRFFANKFGEQSPETLQNNRHYWGPYIALQLMYATIPCVLNHPFLLSMRLQNFRHTMPHAFIHQSFDHITRHAGWIMYFIDLLDKKSFRVCDQTLAYCAVVTATIHLQHSFVPEQALREKSQDGFNKCIEFLRGMGAILPSVAAMADNLEKLKDSIRIAPANSLTGHASGHPRSMDSKLLQDLLIYPSVPRHEVEHREDMFGTSLCAIADSEHGRDPENSTDYNLVGSVGISGHKTVCNEIPAYAPQTAATPRDTAVAVPYLFDERNVEAGEGVSSYEALFLQADDFGRAIDEWMSFNEMSQEGYMH